MEATVPIEALPGDRGSGRQVAISVVVLNFNGYAWIGRCLKSLEQQTLFSEIEVIVADNASTDGSDLLAEETLKGWPTGRFLQNGSNLGYCEGNNAAAALAVGEFLLFLNNDTWLEIDCLEILLKEVRLAGAVAATPLVLNYEDNEYQGIIGDGFDLCGYPSFGKAGKMTREVLMPPGCSYLIERNLFWALGAFDPKIFMYGDEFDLSWRVWISGNRAVAVPQARVHHRLAAIVNPAGGQSFIEVRTSEHKRYLANRNSLLVLLKNCQHVLFVLIPLQLAVAFFESIVAGLLVRRLSFFRRVFLDAIADCWRLRVHIVRERHRIGHFRKRGDLWLLRFFRLRPNRVYDYARCCKMGLPKFGAD